ncbi:jasmonate-induced oxygenase 2-like [Silene latifolia]|uniref:jasmonate-induced oxygenase 2-like n=1 Tax=Silene latifolia TaxID=37657 RepID=UPI003D77BC8D
MVLSTAEFANTLVQEVVKKGEIPEKYIYPDSLSEAIDDPDLWRNNLVIDFSQLFSCTHIVSNHELTKFRSALSQWGCFLVINHGISESLLEASIKVTKEFFGMPLEEKMKCAAVEGSLEGYASRLATAKAQTIDWSDRLYLTLHPQPTFHFWPQNPHNFRVVIDEYSKKLASIAQGVYKAMARSLNLEEDCFLRHQATQGPVHTWFNYYPPCPCPERVLGVRPHTDGSTMTILLPEKGVEGLQVQKDGLWYKVPVIPGGLVVILGDIAEVITNGVFKTVIHRAITNPAKERISMATFYKSGSTDDIEAVKELVGGHRPQMYKKFSMDEYRRMPINSDNPRSRLDGFKS